MTCLPLPFACNSIINTYKAFRYCNSLCRGGRVICLPLPFTGTSIINIHKAFCFWNSLYGGPHDLSAVAIHLQFHY